MAENITQRFNLKNISISEIEIRNVQFLNPIWDSQKL